VSRVFQHFRLKIPLQTLFQSPTVAEMATVIAEYQGEQLDNEKLKNILLELESLSDEEAERLVSEYHSVDYKN
jgi:fructoselysine-6-P-deglycase FrlB-like protein